MPKKRHVTKKAKSPTGGAVKVMVPKSTIPVVITDSAAGVVEIVPAPKDAIKRRSWLERLFG